MKRLVVGLVVIVIFGLIVYTLFSNRASMQGRIGGNRIDAYPVILTSVTKQVVNEQFSQEGLIVANNDVNVVSNIQGPVTKVSVKLGDYVEARRILVEVFDGLGEIRAPISGVIAQLPITEGMVLSSGTMVAEIIDISSLKVKLNVSEQDIFKLKLGEQAVIETDVYPGVKFSGRIKSISVKADEVHNYPVEVVIQNNQKYQLKSGMFAKVSFQLDSYQALLIPRDTLIGSIQNPQVFVMNDGKVNLRNIQVGKEIDKNIVVLQGLSEGDKVVLTGQENLKDNDKVIIYNDSGQESNNNSNFSPEEKSGRGKSGKRYKGL